MPSIEEPTNDFCYIKTMEDDFEVPSSSYHDMGSAKGNQHINQIYPTHSLLILRDHVRTVDLDLLLYQVISFECVGAFYSCKMWPNDNICYQIISTNVYRNCSPSHSRTNHDRVFFKYFLDISEHTPRQFEWKVAIDRIPTCESSLVSFGEFHFFLLWLEPFVCWFVRKAWITVWTLKCLEELSFFSMLLLACR